MARRMVSATPSGSWANAFSRSAETGRSVAAAIAAAWPIASSRVTPPSSRPSVAAWPLLVVASASKPSEPSRTAEPASHGLGMSSGAPGRWSSRKRAAFSAWALIALLLVVLDLFAGAQVGEVGILVELLARAALAQEVPVAVELDAQRLHPRLFLVAEPRPVGV